MTNPNRDAVKDHRRPIGPWSAHATSWARVASPLRPCPEDLQRLKETWVTSLPAGIPGRCIEVLMLGVTPELALYPWAEKTSLRAIDSSEEMIRSVWPGDRPDRKAVLGQWERMPFADASFDLIVSDDGLAMLPEMASLTAVAGELRRLLRRDGRVVMRLFAPTDSLDTEASIVAATEAGEMHNFHGLKLRLLLALDSQTAGRGVRVGDVWDCFERLFPDRESLARRLGCDLQTVATIDTYRGRDGRYIFRSLAEVARVFEGFRMVQGPAGHYPFAEYCPVFSLTPIA
jgi:SAM-dependent methyltransferase